MRSWFGRGGAAGAEGLLAGAMLADMAWQGSVAAPARDPPGVDPGSGWSSVRIDVVEELWGEGFVFPGGAEEAMRLAAPLGLSASSSVLLLGAGTGGAPRVLAEAFDCWVAGHEANATLADLAAARLRKAGGDVARRASVTSWNGRAPILRQRGFHHLVALDPIQGAPTHEMLAAIAGALKPGGQLAMLQLVAEAGLDPAEPSVAAWARLEQRDPVAVAEAEITRGLVELGFDVRVVEDVSERHRHSVMRGWGAMVRRMDGPRPAPLHAAAVVREAERWMRRLRLMQAGQLRLMRWHAIAKAR
jgi:hypothetical protein